MIFASHIYRQSSWDFFVGQQDAVYGNLSRVPAPQNEIVDAQSMYWMGGEL